MAAGQYADKGFVVDSSDVRAGVTRDERRKWELALILAWPIRRLGD